MTDFFDGFSRKKEYLICVDSDGCAMDTMDIKHRRCFGPCVVDEWGLDRWRDPILDRWNDINLYTMTRGINRFKSLALLLTEVDRRFTPVEHAEKLAAWVESAPELSNPAVERMWSETGDPVFFKALSWSRAVNRAINALPQAEKGPFPGAAEGLAAAHRVADVAVVSSANRDAVEEEWRRCGLLAHVDILLCQDTGSKAACISTLMKKGYARNHVLMLGDAPGDWDAARKNGVFFFPILVRHETESWGQAPEAFRLLAAGEYAAYGEKRVQEFLRNLRAK